MDGNLNSDAKVILPVNTVFYQNNLNIIAVFFVNASKTNKFQANVKIFKAQIG